MATALDYVSGDQAFAQAKRNGLTMLIHSGTWVLSKEGNLLHRTPDTDEIRKYIDGYANELIQRCEKINLGIVLEEGYWKIRQNTGVIWASQNTEQTLDFIAGFEYGYRTGKATA